MRNAKVTQEITLFEDEITDGKLKHYASQFETFTKRPSLICLKEAAEKIEGALKRRRRR